MSDFPEPPAALDDFNPVLRAQARSACAALLPPAPPEPPADAPVNTHVHTFHSFNYRDWSPSRAVYEARRAGWGVVGTVDFDVLNALDETFEAGDAFDQRAVVSLETRVFWPERAAVEINSPGEPGVAYHCVAGWTAVPPSDSEAGRVLADLARRAQTRNRAVCQRVNAALPDIAVDYDRDVLPLTPSGNATERHLLAAYDASSRRAFVGDALTGYWAGVLGVEATEAAALLDDTARFRTAMRAKLMKRGGPGYVAPDASSFPSIETLATLARETGALACAAWLDGGSEGESDPVQLTRDYAALGVRAFCLIPDRNWNIADPAVQTRKRAALDAVVEAAQREHFLFAVGTEMNNYGQKTVDDFHAPALAPYAGLFRDGAYALYGHTVMGRAAGRGMGSAWAAAMFGGDRQAENDFYTALGRATRPGAAIREALSALGEEASPERHVATAASASRT